MKPTIGAMMLTTNCDRKCLHCGASPPRMRRDMGRREIDAFLKYGNKPGAIDYPFGILGGNVLGWRGERGEMPGDLIRELGEKNRALHFPWITVFPIRPEETANLDGLKSLGQVLRSGQKLALNISFNAFGRDADRRAITLDEMRERFIFTFRTAKGLGFEFVVPNISFLEHTQDRTMEMFPWELVKGKTEEANPHYARCQGRGTRFWMPPQSAVAAEVVSKCSWIINSFVVMPDGGLVQLCNSVVRSRLEPFASIFDSEDVITEGIAREFTRTHALAWNGKFDICELCVRDSKERNRTDK
ncbi:MAG: radical SAM protein [Candidatus Micrarchaeota archaeon]|nr:radical SAM protein [Candidatus Micrarchaeota archaeon]